MNDRQLEQVKKDIKESKNDIILKAPTKEQMKGTSDITEELTKKQREDIFNTVST